MKPGGKTNKELRAMVSRRLRHSKPARHFGFVFEKVAPGRVVIRMHVRELHKQIQRSVHGGVIATLADTAGGISAMLAAPPDCMVVTVEMKINFLEAVDRGELRADARVIRQGKTISVVDCEITDDRKRLVGKALMTFAVITPRPTPVPEAPAK